MADYWELDFDDHFKILRRVIIRARDYFYSNKDNYGLDFVDHLENEIEQLSLRINKELHG